MWTKGSSEGLRKRGEGGEGRTRGGSKETGRRMPQKEQGWHVLARSTEMCPELWQHGGLGRTRPSRVSSGWEPGGRMNGRREVNVDGPGHQGGLMEVPF